MTLYLYIYNILKRYFDGSFDFTETSNQQGYVTLNTNLVVVTDHPFWSLQLDPRIRWSFDKQRKLRPVLLFIISCTNFCQTFSILRLGYNYYKQIRVEWSEPLNKDEWTWNEGKKTPIIYKDKTTETGSVPWTPVRHSCNTSLTQIPVYRWIEARAHLCIVTHLWRPVGLHCSFSDH